MGSGIAEVAAHSGLDVRVAEATHDAVEAGRRRITTSLDRGVRRGKLSEQQRDRALAGLFVNVDSVLVGDDGRWDIDVTCLVSVDGGVPFTEERWEELGFESGVYV